MTADGPRVRRGERGAVSIQMVVLMPVLFAIAFTGLQAGLYFYGRDAAMAAATTGARAAAAEHGTPVDCQGAARAFISSLGDVLTSPEISCARTATRVEVRVSGVTLSVIPGWQPRVTQSTNLPVERVT